MLTVYLGWQYRSLQLASGSLPVVDVVRVAMRRRTG